MVERPVMQATLGFLLTLILVHISNGQINADAKTSQLDEIQVLPIENSEVKILRETRIKSQIRRYGNNQNKNKTNQRKIKSGQAEKNRGKSKNKIGKKNMAKQKKKELKNKKKVRKFKKNVRNKDKKSRAKKIRTKEGKKTSRQNVKKSGQKKSYLKKKKLRTNNRKSIEHKSKKNTFLKLGPKQVCDEKELCQKIKDYIKISNQLRKVRRIQKSCETMDKKAKKSTTEFEATVTALETAIGSSSGRRIYVYRSRWRRAVVSSDDVTTIKDKLKNCSLTAKAKCQKSTVAPCLEEANLTKCETELKGWLTLFGPSKGSCLEGSKDCCACITALPDVSKDCLAFDQKSDLAVASKKKCTSGNEQGSFGFCRKLQVEAAEKGPKYVKDKCKAVGNMTTVFDAAFCASVDCGPGAETHCPIKCPSGMSPLIYNCPPVTTDTTTTITPTTPLKPFIGGFPESNPAFAYPNPNLTHFANGSVLPLLGNMDNIDKLDLQQSVKWPEFSWETEPGNNESRAFQMFAPDISRLGYTVEGRVYSIICPQQGAYSPLFGSLNVEVTVTGQRGWVNQTAKTMAADMTVVGKIWFGPGAKEKWWVKAAEKAIEASEALGFHFPFSKKHAMVVNTHSRDVTDQLFFSLRDGLSTEFRIPDFAKHYSEAYDVANLRVQIGGLRKTGSVLVDDFNQMILDSFNFAKGNMLKEGNTLYWNVWFTEPENVNRTEWRNHAEKWRDSIDTGHGSPDGSGTFPRYFNQTCFNPLKDENYLHYEWVQIKKWLKKNHIPI